MYGEICRAECSVGVVVDEKSVQGRMLLLTSIFVYAVIERMESQVQACLIIVLG